MDAETFTLRDTFQPFSNGTEHRMWQARNCELGCRNYRPDATTSRDGCPMEVSMSLAAASDGQMPARHGLRCGLLEPAHSGLLHRAEGDRRCPEYRGDDEPDGRPRRGPRPSAGQTDLFDPRGVPARTPTRKVAA